MNDNGCFSVILKIFLLTWLFDWLNDSCGEDGCCGCLGGCCGCWLFLLVALFAVAVGVSCLSALGGGY